MQFQPDRQLIFQLLVIYVAGNDINEMDLINFHNNFQIYINFLRVHVIWSTIFSLVWGCILDVVNFSQTIFTINLSSMLDVLGTRICANLGVFCYYSWHNGSWKWTWASTCSRIWTPGWRFWIWTGRWCRIWIWIWRIRYFIPRLHLATTNDWNSQKSTQESPQGNSTKQQ